MFTLKKVKIGTVLVFVLLLFVFLASCQSSKANKTISSLTKQTSNTTESSSNKDGSTTSSSNTTKDSTDSSKSSTESSKETTTTSSSTDTTTTTSTSSTTTDPEPINTEIKWNKGDGIQFSKDDSTYELPYILEEYPKTIETWIKVPEEVTGHAGIIFGNYTGLSKNPNYITFEIQSGGKPAIALNGAGWTFDVDIRSDEYVYLVITIDQVNQKVKCYVNGLKVGEGTVDVPSGMANLKCEIGGDKRSGNHSCFKGEIKTFSLYSDIKSNDEITAHMKSIDISDTSLIGAYDFTTINQDDMVVNDLSNNNNDVNIKKVWLDDVEHITDYDFSIAVVGDTQTLLDKNPEEMPTIYNYIKDNIDNKKIKYVIGLGDIVEHLYMSEGNLAKEWEIARNAINIIDGLVPYSLVRGNHDDSNFFNSTFNSDTYKTNIDGMYQNKIDNSYNKIVINGYKYLIMTIDYIPNNDMLNWACDVIEANPDYQVIIATHAYLHNNHQFIENGEDIWNNLVKKYENISLVLSGHVQWDYIEVLEQTGINNNKVVSMLIDPQDVDHNGPTGMVAMFYFSNEGRTVNVEYYSTVKQKYFKADNQISFTLENRTNNKVENDTEAPKISVINANVGVKNEEYLIPEIRIEDNLDANITPIITIYKKDDINHIELNIVDNKFIPTEAGTYILKVTATDNANNTSSIEYEIGIRETKLENGLIEDFATEAITNASFRDGANFEWLESFQGKNGVLHIMPNDTAKSYYRFKLFDTLSSYPYPFNTISITVWVDAGSNDAGYLSTSFYDTYEGSWQGVGNSTPKSENGWATVTFSDFYNWDYFIHSACDSVGAQVFWTWTANTHIYIDEIRIDTTLNPEISFASNEHFIDVEEEIIVSYKDRDYIESEIKVYDPHDNLVNLANNKFTPLEKGIYKIVVDVVNPSYFNGHKEVYLEVVGNQIQTSEFETEYKLDSEITIPEAKYIDPKTNLEIESSSVTYVVTKDNNAVVVNDNKFMASSEGVYEIKFTASIADEILDEKIIKVYISNKKLSFAPSQKDFAKNNYEWLESYEGENGVMKINYGSSLWNGYYFKIIDPDDINTLEWDYLEMKVYIPSSTNSTAELYMEGGYYGTRPQTNQWVVIREYKENIQKIVSNMNDKFIGESYLFTFINAGDLKDIYIDYIDVAKFGTSSTTSTQSVGFDFEKDEVKCPNKSSKWLETFEGENGVMKITSNDQAWTGFRVKINDFVNIKDYEATAIEIHVYVKATTAATWQLIYPNETTLYGPNGLETNKWITVNIPIELVSSTSLAGSTRLFGIINCSDLEAVYIDYVDIIGKVVVDNFGSVPTDWINQ